MVFDEPQSRNEAILQNLLGADNVLVDPESRIEAILQSILNETAYLEEPQSRMEELLLAVKDDGSYDDEARSRNEAIIIAWLNDEEYTEEPQSRIEELLIAWLASIPKYVLETVTGKVLSITDAIEAPAEALSVEMLPIQDLHGYESPWPAGGGKNLIDESTIYHGSYNPVTLELSASEAYRTAIIDLPAGTYTFTTWLPDATVLRYAVGNTNYSIGSVSPYTFTVESANTVMVCFRKADSTDITESFHTQIEKGSTSTSWSPYSNLCPITGTEECEVVRCGKNLFDVDKMVNTADITISNGVITVNGNAKNSTKKLNQLADLKEGESYILTATTTASDKFIYLYGSNASWLFGTQRTITQSDLDSIVFFYGGAGSTATITDMMIRHSSVADDTYTPFDPLSTTLDIEWGALGKNLCGGSKLLENSQSYIPSGTTDTEEKTFTFSSSATLSGDGFVIGTAFKPNTAYTFIITGKNTTLVYSNLRIVYEDGTSTVLSNFDTANTKQTIVYTTSASKTVKGLTRNNQGSSTVLYYDECGVFEGTVTASQFEPYTRTIYGGHVDAVRGEIVVTMKSVDLGSLEWSSWIESGTYIFNAVADGKVETRKSTILCSQYAPNYNVSVWSNLKDCEMTGAANDRVYIRDSRYSNVTAFKSAMQGVQLVYELATPIRFPIDPQTLTMLKNNNTIWSDANGDITLTYMAKAGD